MVTYLSCTIELAPLSLYQGAFFVVFLYGTSSKPSSAIGIKMVCSKSAFIQERRFVDSDFRGRTAVEGIEKLRILRNIASLSSLACHGIVYILKLKGLCILVLAHKKCRPPQIVLIGITACTDFGTTNFSLSCLNRFLSVLIISS